MSSVRVLRLTSSTFAAAVLLWGAVVAGCVGGSELDAKLVQRHPSRMGAAQDRQRVVTLKEGEEVELEPTSRATVPNPKILNLWSAGGTAVGMILVRNGSGSSSTAGTTRSTKQIQQRADTSDANALDDAFSVDLSKGVFLRFMSDTPGSTIDVSYDYE